MPANIAKKYGYGLYSARYGNIYTPRQLLQLMQDAEMGHLREAAFWETDQRWFDGLRPNTEPVGFESIAELKKMRLDHLLRVRNIFRDADVFVFTLGLTEAWRAKKCGTIFPTAPGVVAGKFGADLHEFINFGIADCLEDMVAAISMMRSFAPDLKILLTVSPVPLTATASDNHVLSATSYSKSVLRVVAEELVNSDPNIDYFPSYELISGIPFASQFYEENLRNVASHGVDFAMQTFFSAHKDLSLKEASDTGQNYLSQPSDEAETSDVCEEALLEAFAGK